jgi:hypothetical protein
VGVVPIDASSLALVRGAANLAGGLWPLVHLDSFEMIFGPKVDRWLVKAVSGLLIVNGWCKCRAAARMRYRRRAGLASGPPPFSRRSFWSTYRKERSR